MSAEIPEGDWVPHPPFDSSDYLDGPVPTYEGDDEDLAEEDLLDEDEEWPDD